MTLASFLIWERAMKKQKKMKQFAKLDPWNMVENVFLVRDNARPSQFGDNVVDGTGAYIGAIWQSDGTFAAPSRPEPPEDLAEVKRSALSSSRIVLKTAIEKITGSTEELLLLLATGVAPADQSGLATIQTAFNTFMAALGAATTPTETRSALSNFENALPSGGGVIGEPPTVP